MSPVDTRVSRRPTMTTRQMQASPGPEDVIGTPAMFLLGVVFGTLLVVAVVTNGPGAGTGHHHFVRNLLAGLFVLGGGLIGLVITTAMCGRLGLYNAEEIDGEASNAEDGPTAAKMDAQLNRQQEHFLRRLHNTTTPAAPDLPVRRPAPPVHVPEQIVSATSSTTDTQAEPESGHALNQPHGMHFRRRRNRRA